MEKYTLEKTLELIPQSAIKQCYITDSPGHNAAWDYHITPDGRHFIPCCAEGAFAEYVRLYEYYPKSNTVEKKFNLDDRIVVYPRTIRPSKFHTCMCSMPDGRIIAATHTTAAAPTHKEWMPEAYYDHMWEGFMGSNVLIYDPKTNVVEDLGIPVPRESIYGAKYVAEHNCLFFITYYRGHLYRFDLDTRSVTDYGQCTEFGCYLLADGPDGNIYFSSRTGSIWKIDTKTLEASYTGAEIPIDTTVARQSRNVMTYSVCKNGLLYFNPHPGSHIISFDPKSGEVRTVCNALPEGLRGFRYKVADVFGMALDEDGILWYTIISPLTGGDPPLRLCSLDLSSPDPKPVDYGVIGTKERVHVCVEGAYIRDNILYLPDANGAYAPGVAAIDLKLIKRDKDLPRIISTDPKYGKELFTEESIKRRSEPNEYTKNNPFTFRRDTKLYAAKIWKNLGICGSQVSSVDFDGDGNVIAYTEKDGGTRLTIRNGKILKIEKSPLPKKESEEEILKKFEALTLPSHPGRQFLAVANAYAPLSDGRYIVGTKDGCVAIVNKNGKVFSLGAACNDGAVHSIAASPDGRCAVGVAGDPSSLGIVFTYDDENGLNIGGFTYYMAGCGDDRLASVSCEPCCVAFSKDGSRLAIGARDKLGCVYEYELN